MKKFLSSSAVVATAACALAAGAPSIASAAGQSRIGGSPTYGWEYGLNRALTKVDALTSANGYGLCINARVVGGGFVGTTYCTSGAFGSYTSHPYCGCADRQGAARSESTPYPAYGSANQYW